MSEPLRIAVRKETAKGERRGSATPETVKKLVALGASLSVEPGAGFGASIADADYAAAGAQIAAGAAESSYAAQRMARLGLVTMGLCRPVPFKPDELPGITSSLIGNLLAGRSEKPERD